ncbi:hypothetical protein THAR02_07286 [Trichoderma harzianum]|uniref:Uncharacterized protein n=1 Tax=Trichoderma harzianum TaxID=5544 RepID=A0A0G0A642_TRIHA|nr:hypothetical protein THAR02_07286 [Trichoderma harzianum]
MGREHSSSSRRSKSHSSKRKTCKVEHCNRERKSTRHNGETTTYKYCEKRNKFSSFPPFDMPFARGMRRLPMQDAVSNHHPRPYPPVRNATSEIAIVPLLLHPAISARDMNDAPPSPPWSPPQDPVDGSMPSEHPTASSTAASYTTDGRRNSTQSTTSSQTVPPSATTTVAAPAETTMESKVEAASDVADQGKHQMCDDNDLLPTFWSGVSVGICILLQIIHVLMRLLLELAQGVGKRGLR